MVASAACLLDLEDRARAIGAARQRRSKQIAAGVDKQPPSRICAAGPPVKFASYGFGAAASWKFNDRAEGSSGRL